MCVDALKEGKIHDTLESIYKVDNNCFAFLFDDEVYYHFTEYILHQPKERLMWGRRENLHQRIFMESCSG